MAALSHIKSNGVADFTGTVTVFNSAGVTETANATNLVRPGDWNSAHNFFNSISGNTAGTSTASGTNLVFGGSGGITLSHSTAAGAATLWVSGASPDGGVFLSAAGSSQSAGQIVFSNSNGVSFGMNGSTVTGSHNGLTVQSAQTMGIYGSSQTFGQSSSSTVDGRSISVVGSGGVSVGMSAGSLLISGQTTAAQTVQSIGLYGSSQTYGQSSSSTVDARSLSIVGSGGVSVGMSSGSLLISGQTTAAQTAQTQSNVQGIIVSDTTYRTGDVSFKNANGISFGSSGANVLTASYTVPSTAGFLTTARASNDAIGLNTAQTNVVWTVNSSGLSFNAAGYAGTGTSKTGGAAMTLDSLGLKFDGGGLAGTSSGFTGANISASITHNTAGLAMSMSVQPPGAATLTAYAVSNTTQSTSGTLPGSVVSFQGAGGVSVGISNGSIIVQGPDLSSLSATGALSASSNGSTISLGVGTVTASIIGNTTQTSTGSVNLNALVFSAAGGASLGISAGSIIVSGNTAAGGAAISAAGASQNAGTIVFSNSNGVTFGMNGSTVTASVAGASAGVAALGASNTTYTSGTVSLVAGAGAITVGSDTGQRISFAVPQTSSLVGLSGFSVSTNGSTISILPVAGSYFAWPMPVLVNTQTQAVQSNTSVVFPFEVHYVEAFGFVMMPATVSIASMASIATAANNTKSYTQAGTFNFVLYSRGTGANSQSLQSIASTSHSSQMTLAIAQNANGSQWTVTHAFSFPASNTAQATLSTSYATTLSNVNVSTTHLTALSGIKKLGFPWATSLTDGQYWLAFGMGTAQTTNGTASLSNMRVTASQLALSQINQTFGEFGSANAASVQGQFGLGSYSNAAVVTTASIGLSEISSTVSHLVPYISFGRIA